MFTKPGDLRAALPWLKEDNLEENVAVVNKLSEIAKTKGVTTAQFALAWLLAQGDDIFPIPGTKGIHHLTDNLESMSISLSVDEESSPQVVAGSYRRSTSSNDWTCLRGYTTAVG